MSSEETEQARELLRIESEKLAGTRNLQEANRRLAVLQEWREELSEETEVR